ncbi:peptidase M50B-like protein [Leptospira inadai serovar Lyme str. 10]|uniref:Peptidase M50B-like protein n=2 Tax=Leptospira inadai serovar Lyme TaxID=293084 RepID=V6H8I3_9LEPT|nr:M50 family metallopeptidase [Leptospira inadai]EQA35236.1 peptidase M50B-like protein [Leptospira inadai serovar Lyme str. 10]PNV75338.1 peptidase M50 [Leptospira inadai serovar Lyme]
MENRFLRLALLLAIVATLLSYWNHGWVSYLKDFVVFIHEAGHATATLLTGGSVQTIELQGDESGQTIASPLAGKGPFVFVVSAGYLGCCLVGGFLLNRGFKGRLVRPTLLILGGAILLLTLKYTTAGSLAQKTGLSWGIFVLIAAFLPFGWDRLVTVFLGTSVTLYSLYDLLDFTENIQNTDAGILAYWATGSDPKNATPKSVVFLGYLIALLWSFFSVSIIFFSLKRAVVPVRDPNLEEFLPGSSMPGEDNKESPFPGEVTPEVLDWFLSRGLDLNGKPLSPEFKDLEKLDG